MRHLGQGQWILFAVLLVLNLGTSLTLALASSEQPTGDAEEMALVDLVKNDGGDDGDSSSANWPSDPEVKGGSVVQLDSRQENGEWSAWTEWTQCSRSCDGGVSSRTRTCESRHGCRGENIRHTICNMGPCPQPTDFRAHQCSAFNKRKYHGQYYEWEPHYDPQDPCSLTCRTKGENIVAQLYPKVNDGTRCRQGSLDMCIDGKCQPVGCDLQLGSTKKVDACGVCGGNGSSCGHPTFYWQETPMSNCTVSCGGGLQMSKPVCKNKATAREVDERLCDVTTRPAPTTKQCNIEKCPATWKTDDWGQCSVSCSGGFQERQVYCVDTLPNNTVIRVEESRCSARKPKEVKSCNAEDCPRWYETHWSGCSVTCGQGFETMNVLCRDFRGHISSACDPATKPKDRQPCSSGIQCPDKVKPEDADLSPTEMYSPLVHPYLPQSQRFTGTNFESTEPRYLPDPWSPCSVTCGEGARSRTVQCKIYLEFSQTNAVLPDKECPGKKPSETERCVMRPCSLNRIRDTQDNALSGQAEEGEVDKDGLVVTYSWKQIGYTPCSASCLGGVRESIIQCFRDHDQAAVSPFLCDISRKPDAITQTCNDRPCPPRWNVSEYSKCSRTCGGGTQVRQVQCVHEVTRGNTLVIPSGLCPEPYPSTDKTCGVFDCRPQWEAGPWTKCSRSCGGGKKTRKIECKQLLAIGQHVSVRPHTKCPSKFPQVTKTCNVKPCSDANHPSIGHSNQSYVQTSPGLKRISLKVGGRAIVFKGTRLKIKCPVKKFDRARIQWAKDHAYLEPSSSSKRIRVSRKGTLKIKSVQFSDSGVYVCVAGGSKANITLEVKPRPIPYGSSDEDRTVERPGNSVENLPASTGVKVKLPSRKQALHTIEDDDGPDDSNPIEVKEEEEDEEELSHEHAVGHSRPYGSNPNRERPKTKTYSEESPNSLKATMNKFDTFEYQHGYDRGRLFSDQKGGGGGDEDWDDDDSAGRGPVDGSSAHYPGRNAGGVRAGDDFKQTSNPMAVPGIQRILTQVNTLGQAQGYNGPVHSVVISDEADDDYDVEDEMPHSDGRMVADRFVLGKGKVENLKFDWMITNWSACSQSCGGGGVQVRATQCTVQLHNVTKTVDNNLCIDAHLKPPSTFQKCGLVECPHWETGPYSGCSESRCFNLNTSVQRRAVKCLLGNGTQLANSDCDGNTRPREKRECYNSKCRGAWRVGPWSECNAKCEQVGIRSRLLKCVWHGTQRPAGNACREQPRPSVLENCTGDPCISDSK